MTNQSKNNPVDTIAILGITGRTGIQLCSQLLEKQYKIKALVRNSAKIHLQHSNLEVIVGNVENLSDLNKLVQGSDAVISVLGHAKNTPPRFQTNVMEQLIAVMKANECKRIIVLTGSGVPFEYDQNTFANIFINFFIKNLAKNRFRDGMLQCEVLKNSNLDWTVVRTPILTNNKTITLNYYRGYKAPGFLNYISRANVAHFIVEEMEKNNFIQKSPFIWT